MPTSLSNAQTWPAPTKLSLMHRAFVLVAIPLLFELIFVSVLAQVYSQTKSEITRLDHRRQISDVTNALIMDLFDVSVLAKDDLPSVKKLQNLLERLKESVGKLGGLVNDNPEQAKIVDETRAGLTGLTWLLADYRQGHTTDSQHKAWMGDHFENFSDARRKTLYKMASPRLLAMAQDEEQQRLEQTEEQYLANYLFQVKVLLIAGLIFSALISLFIVKMISRGLTDRLKIMTDNAFRLASSVPLNPIVAGDDEIAYLDRVFHTMQETLEDSSRRERALVENAADIICSLDSNHTFTRVSQASLQILGYQPDELIGFDCLNFINEASRAEVISALARIRLEPESSTFETSFVRKNGTNVDVLWSAQWSPPDQSMVSIIHDITEQKDIERIKQEVVKMVTHDLKTPLTTIRIFLEMLQTGMVGEMSSTGIDFVNAADRSAERMLTLINDLLDIEKIKAGMMNLEIQSTSLAELFEEAFQSVSAIAEQRHVHIELRATNSEIAVDCQRIVRVLVNLFSNAVKFSPENGQIVAAGEVTKSGVKISVTDQGRGIAPTMLASIFDPFQQVRTSDAQLKGGSGLGLAICKALVELHGGSIEVQSEEGKGSTFLINLPILTASKRGSARE